MAQPRAPSPPPPDDERWAADPPSRNGSASTVHIDRVNRLVALGYILAASMPPAGFVLGIVLAIPSMKVRSRHGVWIIATSIVASLVWIVIISSGALNTPNTDF
jgi:hypothetical protein